MMATMVGRLSLDELRELIPDTMLVLDNACIKYNDRNLLSKICLLFCRIEKTYYCQPIEPDLIGEYYVIQTIMKLTKEEQDFYVQKA